MQYLNISPQLENKVRERFVIDHSKFIHSSWLILSDLGKTSVINDETWTIIGLWDIAGTRRLIVIKSEAGRYAMVDSKVVANGMGIFNLRNLVTGEELKTTTFGKSLKQLPEGFSESNEKEESSGVWRDDENHEEEETDEEEYVDPLVKALRDSISDEETNDY